MPGGLPPYLVAAAAAFLLVVIATTALWFRWLLRASRRHRLTRLRTVPLAAAAGLAAAPWLYVTLMHVTVSINVDGSWEFALLVAEIFLVYIVWVLWPATYAVIALVWLVARIERLRASTPQAPPAGGNR